MIPMALLGIVLTFTQSPNDDLPKVVTRFGTLAVDKDRMLLFNGKPVRPPVQGNNSLDLGTPFDMGASDVVLVKDTGGTACPVLYYFVTVTRGETHSVLWYL